MAVVPFGSYAPDISSYKSSTSQAIYNVIARADGYGPFNDLLAFTSNLPGPCRGYFYGRASDGTVQLFAGTATDLYLLDNTAFTWVKVSISGGYSQLSDDANWQFAQFGNLIFATQENAVLQSYNMTSSTLFANQTGSPPQAAYIAIVGQFVVLSGLLNAEYRMQWSGLNDPTNWTAGLNQSDYQDFPDGGIVRGVAGGEYGVVFQDTTIRAMVYDPGSPVVFTLTRIGEDVGLFAPYGIVRAVDKVFFPSTRGFQYIESGSMPQPIGKEIVDRTFFAAIDQSNLQLCIGFSDPSSTRVGWAFKSVNGGIAGAFDTILLFDYVLNQWTEITSILGQYIASLAKPGVTLAGLDAIAPGVLAITGAANNGAGLIRITVGSTATLSTGQIKSISGVVGTTEANATNWTITVIDGTHFDLQGSAFVNAYVSGGIVGGSLDAMTQSLDSFPASALVALSCFNDVNGLGFFNGPALQAILQTSDQGADGETRTKVGGLRPVTDAPTVYASIGGRENLQNAIVYSPEVGLNKRGICTARVSTRYARAQIRIPYGQAWTFASGVEPIVGTEGKR